MMQETDSTYERNEQSDAAPRPPRRVYRRYLVPFAVFLTLILVAFAVPFLNINRFQRRIVTSLSQSLGRPIHLDRISLSVFPLPGLTINNLVISEDPAFGAEPFVRSSTVRATLRVSSLWRRRIEFTRISFTDPSINLVKTNDGKWNLESILLQAARIQAAPTGQIRASSAPRFPYIEASGARLNLKLGVVKTPFSLTEAELALWLDNPQEWRLRLDGRPLRTDTNVSDTGMLQLEGTLGRAASLQAVPIDLKAAWRNAPLGEATHVIFGSDAGLRGLMTLSATARGTIGQSAVQAALHLANVRRADFVPVKNLSIDAMCDGTAQASFQAITEIRCSWPPTSTSTVTSTDAPKTFALTGSIPDTHHVLQSAIDLGTPGIPAASLLDWLHVISSRISPEVTATGSLAGSVFFRPTSPLASQWGGQLTLANGTVTLPSLGTAPVFTGVLTGRVISLPGDHQQRAGFILAPVPLTLGGRDFATLEGRFDQYGYTLHLTGTALTSKLLALGAALPPLGDGLSDALPKTASPMPLRFDLNSTRSWGSPQFWDGSRTPAAIPRHFLHR